MFTENYYKMMNKVLNGKSSSDIYFTTNPTSFVLPDGSTVNALGAYKPFYNDTIGRGTDTGGFNIDFGTGTTAPTFSDYCLEEVITSSSLSILSSSIVRTDTSIALTMSVRNIVSDPIVISEFGCYTRFKTNTLGTGVYYYALVLREVFTPTTIAVGATETITIRINNSIILPN